MTFGKAVMYKARTNDMYLLDLAKKGIGELFEIQKDAIGDL